MWASRQSCDLVFQHYQQSSIEGFSSQFPITLDSDDVSFIVPDSAGTEQAESVSQYTESESESEFRSKPKNTESELLFSCIELPESAIPYPQSCYEPFEAPHPVVYEKEALQRLLPTRTDADDFLELQLSDFAVYCDNKSYPGEMRSLNQLDTNPRSTLPCFFNGTLSNATESLYVRHVRIAALPIGNYGQESVSQTRDCIWIQSAENSGTDVFYKLQEPAPEYKRFYEPFIWVADLAKHVVDFFTAMRIRRRSVTIHDFRLEFAHWLQETYILSRKSCSHHVQLWMRQYPRLDYRSAVNTNVDFIYKEAMGALGWDDTRFHRIWDQILDFTACVPYHAIPSSDPRTVVTSYIFQCFSHLPFGSTLKVFHFADAAKKLREKLLTQPTFITFPGAANSHSTKSQGLIKPGDTISTCRDTAESGTTWAEQDANKADEHVEKWFALVQSVSVDSKGHRVLEVIWYYRPDDTLCGVMRYPWSNELFLSDHCSCQESCKIREDEVLGVHEVDFGGTPQTSKEFFCRQTYLSDERAWITLTSSHLRCCHSDGSNMMMHETIYKPGDTLLVRVKKDSAICDPCELVEIGRCHERTKVRTMLTFRRLLRRRQVDPRAMEARVNEVVYTSKLISVPLARVIARCQVRWFDESEQIPTPYDRDGVGAFFFMTHQMVSAVAGDENFTRLAKAPSSLHQGNDVRFDVPKLRGLDLFCGGGNFGRGLEEGGSVEMKWANDMNAKALHTYMANMTDQEQVSPFLGSIDDFQRLAIQGKWASNVPQIGHVDFISGGSPCPGFSLLTNNKETEKQRKNQSLVASFASCVDVYRPKYGILENVVGIIQNHRNRDQDVFSQLMCALVGMGYQARLLFLDAFSCGSAQYRPRVFIMFAASGWALPEIPLQTHSHPPNVVNLGLGKLPTGKRMASREMAETTPFRYRSAAQSSKGLPRLYDAKPDICVGFPDHRVVSHTNTKKMRSRIGLIPKFPWGMNFSQAWYGYYGEGKRRGPGRGVLSRAELELFLTSRDYDGGENMMSATGINSNAYGRQKPNLPIWTVVTNAGPGDAKQGRSLHWDESRCLSILEVKRAQGFLDEEILLGSSVDQRRIVGNSVAREVALALGWVVSKAVMKTYDDGVGGGIGGVGVGVGVDVDVDVGVGVGVGVGGIRMVSDFWTETSAREATRSQVSDTAMTEERGGKMEEEEETPATSVAISPDRSPLPWRKNRKGNKRRRIKEEDSDD